MPAWLLAVVAINFILQVAVTAARPLTSVRALALGADGLELGLLAAAYAALALVLAVPIGRLIDRYRRSMFIVVGCIFVSLMLVVTAFAYSTIALIAIQAGIGLALINANLGMQSTIAATSAPKVSAAAFGHYSTGAGVGQLAGPALAGLLVGVTGAEAAGGDMLDPNVTNVAFLVFAGIAGIAVVVALMIPATAGRAAASPPAPKDTAPAQSVPLRTMLLRSPGVKPVLVASAIVVTSLDLLAIYMPAYGLQHGYSIAYVGALLSIAAAGSIAARLMIGAATRLLGRPTLMLLSLLAPAAALVVLPFLPAAMLPLDMIVVGMGLGFGQPLTMSWIASLADADRLAATLGVRVSGNRVGQLIVPVVVGSVVATTSLAAGFWTLAAFLAATAIAFSPPLAGRLAGNAD